MITACMLSITCAIPSAKSLKTEDKKENRQTHQNDQDNRKANRQIGADIPGIFSLAAGAFLPSSFAFQVPVLLSSKRRFLLKSKTITRVLTKFMLRLRLAFTKCVTLYHTSQDCEQISFLKFQ